MGKNRNSKSWTFFLPAVLFSAAAVLILLAGCEKSLLRLSIEDMAGYTEVGSFDFSVYDSNIIPYYSGDTFNFGDVAGGNYIYEDFGIHNSTNSEITITDITVSDDDSDTNFYLYFFNYTPPYAIKPDEYFGFEIEFYSDGSGTTEYGIVSISTEEYNDAFELNLEGYCGYSGSC
jgi:hypothetical protein